MISPNNLGRLVFEENFTNLSKWYVAHWHPTTNNELQYYTYRPENVNVVGGNLQIRALAESYGGYNYTSGRLHSYAMFSVGKVVSARIKIPAGQGLWPAFWLLGHNWPNGGEIDILEALNDAFVSHHTVHAGSPHWSHGLEKWHAQSLADAWHVYSIKWTRGRIEFYIDYRSVGVITKDNTPAGRTWPFDTTSMFLVLNLAVGGWAGQPQSSSFPATMLVDWVRVNEVKRG